MTDILTVLLLTEVALAVVIIALLLRGLILLLIDLKHFGRDNTK